MLKTLTITNFRSIGRARLEFGKVNLFIGPNGGGKSNILEGIGVNDAALPAPHWAGSFRATYCEALLRLWLRLDALSAPDDTRHLLVIPVWAPETWLVAALDARWPEPEEQDPVPHLIRLRPAIEHQGRPGRLTKRGSVAGHYEVLARLLADNLHAVRQRCLQLDRFCLRLERLATISMPHPDRAPTEGPP